MIEKVGMTIHQQETGHRKCIRKNDIVNILQEEDRQHRIKHKEEFDPYIDPQRVDEARHDRVRHKIQQPRRLMLLLMIQEEHR